MFAGIDTSRPWPKTEMTTEKWKQIPPIFVPLNRLIATQEGVKFEALIGQAKPSFSGDNTPHVVSWRGNLYLEDGHHRAVRAAVAGQTQVFARVLAIIDHGE